MIVYVRTNKGMKRGEVAWQSEKGPWTFIRMDGRLRAVPNKCIVKESTISAFI